MKSSYNKLSIVIPVYNEKELLPQVLEQLEAIELPLEKEIVIVDDMSTDGSREYIDFLDKNRYTIILKDTNEGKGSALRAGFQKVTGDIVLIQDADLEYDIEDYPTLIESIVSGEADVVYGSRLLDMERFHSDYRMHVINNRMITFVSNLFTGLSLTDMETCYKVYRRDVFDSFKDKLVSNRFGIEPEMTQYVARGGWRLKEVPISYRARTFAEGKKITIVDGFAALWHILKFYIRK